MLAKMARDEFERRLREAKIECRPDPAESGLLEIRVGGNIACGDVGLNPNGEAFYGVVSAPTAEQRRAVLTALSVLD